MFSKILVALDQGDTCTTLFQHAVTLAQSTGAGLMLLSVLELENDGSFATPASYGYPLPLGVDRSIWLELYREAEAKGLLAESARLAKEAAALEGVPAETTTAPKRGRPAKAKVADATQG